MASRPSLKPDYSRSRGRRQLGGWTLAAFFATLVTLFAYHWIIGDDLRDLLIFAVSGVVNAFSLMVAFHFKERSDAADEKRRRADD